jgi:hypothetical protein
MPTNPSILAMPACRETDVECARLTGDPGRPG